MGKRYRSILKLLAVMIIIASILSGCSKNEDMVTFSQETTSTSIIKLTTAPTDKPLETPTNAPIAVVAEESNAIPIVVPTTEPIEIPMKASIANLAQESITMPTVLPTTKPTEVSTGNPNIKAISSPEGETTVEIVKTVVEEATFSTEPNEGMFDPWYTVATSIAYSSGTESDWSYGNQRKEFNITKPCYVRIGSSIVAVWHWGWRYGEGNKIAVTYRFTGAEHCKIEISDGFATEVKTGDSNVVLFTRILTVKSSMEEDVVVFRYTPDQAGKVSLEVIYDNQIKSKNDVRNTVYFVNDEW